VELGEQRGRGRLGDVAPCDRGAQPGLGFVERAARAFEAQPRVACRAPEALAHVERDTAQSPANLRCQIAIAASNLLDQWPSHGDDQIQILKLIQSQIQDQIQSQELDQIQIQDQSQDENS
jgi:hypothetical protein